MMRLVWSITLESLASIVLALVLLTLAHVFAGVPPAEAVGEAAHHVFLFMDIGLGVWVLLRVAAVIRFRELATSIRTVIFAMIAAFANLLTLVVVGFLQRGGIVTQFIGFALEAGVAFVVAVLVVVALLHGVTRRARHARVARAAN